MALSMRLARTAWDKGEALAASGDLTGALAWLGRAHRIAPADQNICFGLARLRLRAGDSLGAAALFAPMALKYRVRECFGGLIAASLAAGRIADAADAAQSALSETATDAALAVLAARVVSAGGFIGWCGLSDDGLLLTDITLPSLSAHLDGNEVELRPVSAGKFQIRGDLAQARWLHVRTAGKDLVGSPIAIDRVWRVEGFVERCPEGLKGWAWYPGAPGLDPTVQIVDEQGDVLARLAASAQLESVEGATPLARPRGFTWPLPAGQTARVLGPDGRDLLGSPLSGKSWPPRCPRKGRLRRLTLDVPVDVVIPVYRGLQTTLDCITSVLGTVPTGTRIWVVDDASPDRALVAELQKLDSAGSIRLIPASEERINRGFPAAANAGLRAASGRHVVLLNSDTLVAPRWLETLRDAACSAPDIGTATPISNEASILSYPAPAGENTPPDIAGTRQLAALAAIANQGRLVEIPTAHGFCMFIRRDCLDQTGFLDEDLFAQGYGEENDFCERARALGWRHVAVPGVYVAHLGGVSFGGAREHLLRRNLRLLEQRHPAYHARVAAWIAADPLAPARRRLDAARWRGARQAAPGHEGKNRPGFLLITHGGGGGTTRIVTERALAIRARGQLPIVLRAVEGWCEVGDSEGLYPNLRFALPEEFAALLDLLRETEPLGAELHHLLGHDHSVVRLFAELNIPYDVWVHDYAWFCARLSFVTGEGRFCGEAGVSTCDSCVAQWGSELEEHIAPAALRRRSASDMRGARSVVVPSEDVARRVARHVPGLKPSVQPWEKDPPPPPPRWRRSDRQVGRVAVIGAIGIEKGFDVLLACARDAASRRLPLEFVVVGYTVDDEKLLQTGRVFVTGAFSRAEAGSLIRAQSADLAFLPSIWPETWCYALSDAWAGGLPAAAFDIGTPPARIRAAGRGWVLPLGLPATRVNDVLISLAMLNTVNTLPHFN